MDVILALFFIFLSLFLSFSLFHLIPLLFGAPFQPTNERKLKMIMELAKIKRGDIAVDLGSGDGRLVIALAKAGAKVDGYEINPLLVWYSRIKIRRARVNSRAKIYWKNFWNVDLSKYNVVTLFQFGTIMEQLEKKLSCELKRGSRIVSYYWQFPKWKLVDKVEDVFLYKKK